MSTPETLSRIRRRLRLENSLESLQRCVVDAVRIIVDECVRPLLCRLPVLLLPLRILFRLRLLLRACGVGGSRSGSWIRLLTCISREFRPDR